jgi:two-component system, OmpR family, KDP operon response regulator KdpE
MQEIKSTILVVDDEALNRKRLSLYLDSCDYKFEESETGRQAVRMVHSVKPDLILLDLSLPDIDGKEVISEIREGSHVPIIALAPEATDEEAVAVLNAGADDYLAEPFTADVLAARVKANLRKAVIKHVGKPELVNGPVRMDLMRHETYLGDQKVTLTPKEYKLLRYFMVNRGRMLTHRQILNEVWGASHVDNTQYLRVYVGQLREKLEYIPSNPAIIRTEPGVGYRMETMERELSQVA